jgi:hypothetical protein
VEKYVVENLILEKEGFLASDCGLALTLLEPGEYAFR